MNRRTVLGLAGTSAVAGLSGCLDGIREHFGLQGVVPIEIYNESDRTHNIVLEARERDTDRQSYEESYSVTPGETVSPPHLDGTDQSLRVARIVDEEEAQVEAVSVTSDTELVVIRLYENEFEVEVRREDGEDDGNGTNADGNETDGGNGTNAETADDDAPSESERNETDD